MTRLVNGLAISVVALMAGIGPVAAQSPAEFYRGKTVQFMVGYPPSGGFDAYTRAAARFIGKHIPGTPTVIVTNMPGASSLQFVRYLMKQAPKDGTQFGMFNRGLMPKAVLDPKVGIDFAKFTWIGSMNSELAVCYIWGAKGVKTIDQLKHTNVTLGDTSKNSFWVALLTYGEGWHNNHHAHPQSARHGLTWYEIDMNWYAISILRALGLVWDVKAPRLEALEKKMIPHASAHVAASAAGGDD